MYMEKIGIVIPAYNEAGAIDTVLLQLSRSIQLGGKTFPLYIIVVNDGSTDDTIARVSKHKDVALINHLLNSGAGAATRTGMHYALQIGCDYAITMDADGQHDPADVMRVVRAIIGARDVDMIIGSRLQQRKGMPWYRVIGNLGLSLITMVLFGVRVSDSQSGLKGMNRKALERISFHSDRYAFCSEMIWRAHQEGLRIREIPIKAIYTEYSLKKGQGNVGAGIALVGQLIKHRLMDFIHG